MAIYLIKVWEFVHVIVMGVVVKCSCYRVVKEAPVTVTILLLESQCESINKDVRGENFNTF